MLPADTTYGIYVVDADNSGYAMSCAATDAQGQAVRMGDPSWSISSSDTETLDLVYTTGSGDLTITCPVAGEIVTTRPVPDYRGLVLGALGAGAMAALGGVLIVTRSSRPRLDSMPGVHAFPQLRSVHRNAPTSTLRKPKYLRA